jgi:hypothetical protein
VADHHTEHHQITRRLQRRAKRSPAPRRTPVTAASTATRWSPTTPPFLDLARPDRAVLALAEWSSTGWE